MSWAGFLRLLGIATSSTDRYPQGNYITNMYEKEVTIYNTIQPMHRIAYDHQTQSIYVLNLESIKHNKDHVHTVLALHKTYLTDQYNIMIKPKNRRAVISSPGQKVLCVNKSNYKVVPCEMKVDIKGYIRNWKIHASTSGFKIRDAENEWCMIRENSMGIIALHSCSNTLLEERFDMMEVKDDPYKRMYLTTEEEIQYSISGLDPSGRLPTWMVNGLTGAASSASMVHSSPHHENSSGMWDGYGKNPHCTSPQGCPWDNSLWSGQAGGSTALMNMCIQQCTAGMGVSPGPVYPGANPNSAWGSTATGVSIPGASTYPWHQGSAGVSGANSAVCIKQCTNNNMAGIEFPGPVWQGAGGTNTSANASTGMSGYPVMGMGSVNTIQPAMNSAAVYPSFAATSAYPAMSPEEMAALSGFEHNMKKIKKIVKSIARVCKQNKKNRRYLEKARAGRHRTARRMHPFDDVESYYPHRSKKERRDSSRYTDEEEYYIEDRRHRKKPVYYEEEYYTGVNEYPTDIAYERASRHKRRPSSLHPYRGRRY